MSMATLETQYSWYLSQTPDTTPMNFEEWKVYFGNQLQQALKKWEDKKNLHWECDECGFQEYTSAISEEDVHELHCSNCGGWSWHLVPYREE